MLAAFWSSLGLVFIAELGDKTQLVALTMAARYRAGVVLAGVFVATLLVHLFSVGIGGAAARFLPAHWIAFLAGLAFIVFGLWTLRGDCLDGDEKCKTRSRSPFMIVAVTFFLAELGDKTMLTTVTCAGDNAAFLMPVWIGSSLGMVVSDGLAILVGQVLGAKLPERAVKIGAACIFFAFGLYKAVWEAGASIPVVAWTLGVFTVAALGFVFLGLPRMRKPSPATD